MLKYAFATIVAFGLVLAINSSALAAEEGAAAGVITGTVVDKDGKAVAEATVALAKPRAEGATARPEPLATAKTDKDGKFELKFDKAKVADGDYNIGASAPEKGAARAKVTIKDGKAEPASVELKLQPRTGRGGAVGGGAAPAK